MREKDFSSLKRTRNPMLEEIKQALLERGLMHAYKARPLYQQNDYIGWITRAKSEETRNKRLQQMLEELHSGDRYMKMKYQAKQ